MRILPRPFAVVINAAMATLARTWKTLVPIAILVFIPASAATLAAFSIPGALEFVDAVLTEPETLAELSPEEFSARSAPFMRAVAITLLVQALAVIFVFVCSHRVVVAHVREEPFGRGAIVRGALRAYLPAALAGVLSAAAALGLFFLGFTIWSIPAMSVRTPNATTSLIAPLLLVAYTGPGTWLAVSLSMVTSTVAVEGKGVFQAMRRSAALVKGRWWATFGFILMVGFLGGVAMQLVQLVAIPITAVGGGGNAPVASLLGVLGQGPIVVAMGVTFTSWYLDLRSRQEPLQIDQL